MNNYGLAIKTLFEVPESISTNCLQVLPPEPKKKLQKFVIGSQNHMEIWECKKGEMKSVVKSEPQSEKSSQYISRVFISKINEEKFSIFFSIG